MKLTLYASNRRLPAGTVGSLLESTQKNKNDSNMFVGIAMAKSFLLKAFSLDMNGENFKLE